MISDTKVQKLFEKIGETVQSSSYLGKGEASIVLKIKTNKGTYALKTALYPKRKKKILNEANIRTSFIKKGLSFIPRPIYVDKDIFSNGAVIYEYAEGKKPENFSEDNIRQFAHIVSEIHKTDFKIVNDGYSQIQKLFDFLKKIIKSTITRYPHLVNPLITQAYKNAIIEYEQMISNERDKFTIGINAQLHGDLSDNFVIDDQNKIWLLDWENSEYDDITGEVTWFLFVNHIKPEYRTIFYEQYKKHFEPARRINFEEISIFYYAATPVFNICWGIDQLDMNLKQNLEPERKLKDLAKSAKDWKKYFSDDTSSLIIKGINKLKQELNV